MASDKLLEVTKEITNVVEQIHNELSKKEVLGELRQSRQFSFVAFSARFESLKAQLVKVEAATGKDKEVKTAIAFKFATSVLGTLSKLVSELAGETDVTKPQKQITELVSNLSKNKDNLPQQATEAICENLGIE